MSIDEKALSNVCKWAEHRGLDWSIAREVVMAYEAAKAPATGQPVMVSLEKCAIALFGSEEHWHGKHTTEDNREWCKEKAKAVLDTAGVKYVE